MEYLSLPCSEPAAFNEKGLVTRNPILLGAFREGVRFRVLSFAVFFSSFWKFTSGFFIAERVSSCWFGMYRSRTITVMVSAYAAIMATHDRTHGFKAD